MSVGCVTAVITLRSVELDRSPTSKDITKQAGACAVCIMHLTAPQSTERGAMKPLIYDCLMPERVNDYSVAK
jgi:hypothetical protein